LKETHAQQAADQRARLAQLRAAVGAARADKRTAAAEVRAGCHVARQELPAQLRAYRETEKARLRRELTEARQGLRNRCQAAKIAIRARGLGAVESARLALLEERKTARAIREAERKIQRTSKGRASAAERRGESDDEVRGNIPPELVPIWDRVRRQIHAGPRTRRTEAFLEWVHDNADLVIEMRAKLAEADFARQLKEHHAEEKARHRATPRRQRPTAAELAAVPF
jgi:hypothetical protein